MHLNSLNSCSKQPKTKSKKKGREEEALDVEVAIEQKQQSSRNNPLVMKKKAILYQWPLINVIFLTFVYVGAHTPLASDLGMP